MDRPASAELVNIAAHLPAMARRQPDRMAVVFPKGRDTQGKFRFTHYTFQQLDQESDFIARGFNAIGIRRGTRTVLMVTPSLEFFALTFALFKAGAVPVMIDPGIGIKNLGVCLAEAKPEAFIGIPKAHIARLVLGWGKETLRTFVTVGTRLFWGGHTLAKLRDLGAAAPTADLMKTQAEDQAAILFTSGSTGVPKGVVYTHGMFADQVEKLRQLYDIQSGEIDLPTFPLFGLFAPALGMTAVIPEMDPTRPAMVHPPNIIDAIHQFQVTNMFGSPALINRVGRYGEQHGTKLPSLKRVISAGAPVAAKALERYTKMLSPGVQIFTPYGATESLPVSSIGSDEILGETRQRTAEGHGVCIGRPVPGMTAKVIAITDSPIKTWSEANVLPEGEIGEIVVQSGNVTREYYNRPESTALAKIPDPANGEFYHRMGDVGYLDDSGRLWFCGRKTHRVITPNGTMFTIPCEAIFNNHPKVFRSALVGVQRNGTTEPVICIELEAATQNDDQNSIRAELLKLGAASELTRTIKTVLFHPAFPVDIRHNAKIFREKLATWAVEQMR
jgi:acyl-CoA synthetase (AMP-forming)/AMP-acid ligase II